MQTLYILSKHTLSLLLFCCLGTSILGQKTYDVPQVINNIHWERATLKPLSINTNLSDFSPILYNNGLLFASSRKDFGHEFIQMYHVQFDYKGKFKPLEKLPESINIKNKHCGPASIDIDRGIMFFTRAHKKTGKPQIYTSKYRGGNWIDVKPMVINDKEASFANPSISPDGNSLVFASNINGGMGGMDLYISYRISDGVWSEPENLGENINTSKDDVFPSFQSDGRLFFSSNGHNGYGGLDIFLIQQYEDEWSEVQHLPNPINSKNDDFGLILDKTNKKGYLSSNRYTLEDNIYRFKIRNTAATVTVLNSITRQPIDNITVSISGGYKPKTIPIKGGFNIGLKPEKKYSITIGASGHKSKTIEVSTERVADERNLPFVVELVNKKQAKKRRKKNKGVDDKILAEKDRLEAERLAQEAKIKALEAQIEAMKNGQSIEAIKDDINTKKDNPTQQKTDNVTRSNNTNLRKVKGAKVKEENGVIRLSGD